MNKEKKYEMIWSLILIIGGSLVSLIGIKVFPLITLILVFGIAILIIGIVNIFKIFAIK